MTDRPATGVSGFTWCPRAVSTTAGATWLGWDSVAGIPVAHPEVDGLPDTAEVLTRTPRKYGFHGTIKPPFTLAAGTDANALSDAAAAFCASRAPVTIPRLEVRRLGGFIAVVPTEPSAALADLAAATVAALDAFRAPPSEAELARRRKARLTDRQEALLLRWGYPYVMEEFRFHLTLTGRLEPEAAEAARAALARHFAEIIPKPWTIGSLCLMGEDAQGVSTWSTATPFRGRGRPWRHRPPPPDARNCRSRPP
jgi:putative phosphonate metabolism protein